jgi:hypothetical protein
MKSRIAVLPTGDYPSPLPELAIFLEDHHAALAHARLRDASVRTDPLPVGAAADSNFVARLQRHPLGKTHPVLSKDILGGCLRKVVAAPIKARHTLVATDAGWVVVTPALISSHGHRSYGANYF